MKVRKNSIYTYDPVLMDLGHKVSEATKGQRVRVIQLPSAPPPNTMGQCHIEDADTGEFLGMCCTNSLRKG